ncbi:type II secretion system protein [Candidatus Parcubacteria bacterium]|nr:type II secretion system protein [Candidatus Parcubacteria bacterium]
MNKISKNKAFTLIEVLIVTAVISLVASIVNAQMGEARQKAEDAHMKTEVQQVRNAVEQYRQRTGSVPIPTEGNYTAGSMISESENPTEYRSAMQQLVAEKLIPEIPTSPSGQSYSYLATDDTKESVFAAVLNNDSSGGSGGSNTNSCEVIENEINFISCTSPWEELYISCSEVELNSNQVCYHYMYYLDYCWCSNDEIYSSNEDIIPTQICQLVQGGSSCDSSFFGKPLGGDDFVCDYEGGSVCDGFNNSDYCSCI